MTVPCRTGPTTSGRTPRGRPPVAPESPRVLGGYRSHVTLEGLSSVGPPGVLPGVAIHYPPTHRVPSPTRYPPAPRRPTGPTQVSVVPRSPRHPSTVRRTARAPTTRTGLRHTPTSRLRQADARHTVPEGVPDGRVLRGPPRARTRGEGDTADALRDVLVTGTRTGGRAGESARRDGNRVHTVRDVLIPPRDRRPGTAD